MANIHILQDVDIPFTERLKLRENALAWISRDVGGIRSFVFPKAVVDYLRLTPVQIETSLREILQHFFVASTPCGREALIRTMAREHAAHLRHCAILLRRNELTYTETARYSIMLESLWDSINTEMSDATWARCSLHFDTALAALRVIHILLYLRQEFPCDLHPTPVRVAVFVSTFKSLFNDNAPTDDAYDKHSSHFKQLMAAWRREFDLYATPNFEHKIRKLEHHHGNAKTADILDQFLNLINIDDNWMLRAYQIESDFSAGRLRLKNDRNRMPPTDPAGLPTPQPAEDLDELGFDEEEESNKGEDNDADFDYNLAVANSRAVSTGDSNRGSKRSRRRSTKSGSQKSPRVSLNVDAAHQKPIAQPHRRKIELYPFGSDIEGDDIPLSRSKQGTPYHRKVHGGSGVLDDSPLGSHLNDYVARDESNVLPISSTIARALESDERAAALTLNHHVAEGSDNSDEIHPLPSSRAKKRARPSGGKRLATDFYHLSRRADNEDSDFDAKEKEYLNGLTRYANFGLHLVNNRHYNLEGVDRESPGNRRQVLHSLDSSETQRQVGREMNML